MKYPLKEVVVINKDEGVLRDISALQNYIKEELNVRNVTVTTDKHKYGVHLRAEPDHKTLGARLKGAFKAVTAAIKELSDDQLMEFQRTGEIEVAGHTLSPEDLRLIYTFSVANDPTQSNYEAHSDSNILVLLDVSPDDSMVDEGLAREVINRIQKLRKKAKLVPTDDVTIYYKTSGTLARVVSEYDDFIFSTIKQPLRSFPLPSSGIEIIITEDAKVKQDTLDLTIVRGHVGADRGVKETAVAAALPPDNGHGPACRYVNVEMVNGKQATVLLENPRGEYQITFSELVQQVKLIFGLRGKRLRFYARKGQEQEVTEAGVKDILSLHSQFLYVSVD